MTLSNRRVRFTRNGILFTVGVLGIIHEVLIYNTERPTLLILLAGCAGVPFVLNKDERNQAKEDAPDKSGTKDGS